MLIRSSILALALAATIPGFADAILPDGTFHEFVAYNLNGPVTACGTLCNGTTTINPLADTTAAPPWTFSGPATLLVLDLFYSGDQYQVFDNSVSLGITSAAVAGTQCGPDIYTGDIGCSLANLNFSRGTYNLGSGNHSITINYVTGTVVGHSGGALELTSAAPEPAAWILVVVGAGTAACLRRLWRRARNFQAS